MSDDTVYERFRFTNDDGSSKDWAIAVAPPGLQIRYCRTGSNARLSEVPDSRLVGRSAEHEMQDRIDKKLAKGYYNVGAAKIVDGRLDSLTSAPTNDLYWETIFPLEIGPLTHFLTRLSNELSNVSDVSCQMLNQYQESTAHPNVRTLMSTGLQVELQHGTWMFGQQDGGGLDREGRGGGRVSIRFGPVPFLILMAMEREFPSKFRFANYNGSAVTLSIAEDDQFLGETNATMAEIVEIGATLGLCLGPIRLSESAGESTERTLWF